MATRVSEPLYTRAVLALAAAIPCQSGFDFDGAERQSRTCGSRARVAVTLDSEGRVASFRQAVEACAFGQAAAALMGAHAVGRSRAEVEAAVRLIADWLDGDDRAGTAWPGLEALAPARPKSARHGAILLPFQTLSDAIGIAA